MNLKQLKCFDIFINLRSATKVARVLGISQPMVSRLLNQLEESVGFPLFERKKNHLTPTPEALMFHGTVARSLKTFQEMENEATAIANKQVGSVIIAAQPIYVDTFLLDVISEFRQTHPNVPVKLLDQGMEGMVEMLHERQCDLAIGITLDLTTHGINSIKLGTCEVLCILPENHPLAEQEKIDLCDLAEEYFVELTSGSPLRTRVDYMMQSRGWRRKIAVETRSLRVLCELVKRGTGIGLVDPFTRLLPALDGLTFRQITTPVRWDIAVFRDQNHQLIGAEKALVDLTTHKINQLRGLYQVISD